MSRLESTVIASRASGTTDAFGRAFQRWKSFASSKDEMQVFFSARTEHVVLYLQHVLDIANSHSWVDSAIYGIQWAYNLAGFSSPTDSPIIHSISRVVKKLLERVWLTRWNPYHLKRSGSWLKILT